MLDGRQLQLFEARLASIGVDRRDFLRILAGMTAAGTMFLTTPLPTARAAPSRGEKLAKAQVFRRGDFNDEPSSFDVNKDLYCNCEFRVFAGLMRFTPDFVAVPWLAEKVESKADGSEWTFHLRKDAKWSNGDAVTAHDFAWSWKRQLDPATAAPYSAFLYDLKNGEAFNKGQVKDANEVGVKALDDHTLQATLEGPRGYFPVLVAYAAALPAHRPSVEKHGDKWTEPANIVTNGPWVLESWDHHKQFTLKKNPHYFDRDNITLERVIYPIIPRASGFLPYDNNEIDYAVVPPGDLRRLRADPKASKEVIRYFYPGTFYLVPQTTKSPFDHPQVRRAVSHAIDRKIIAERVSQGFGIPAHAMIPPGLPGHFDDEALKQLQRFDPKLAMENLKGTPYEGGKNWPKIVISMRDEPYAAKPMAEGLQAMLREVLNMPTELEVLEPRVFRERLWKQDLQLIWIRWFMDYPDPHNEYFDTFYGKRTTGKRQAWANDAFDDLISKARGDLDTPKRMTMYRQAEEVLQKDVGYIPVVWTVRYVAFKPWVKGLPRNKEGHIVPDGNIYRGMLDHIYIVEH
ncbi:MAG TPA: peptide ABC transporter substrate-binding protein [Candidatus Tectomicrobia bacterium]|nr:peptide ABC transporter substrate-binding protein [Candidatus Tectomicrobia bacterium]